MFRSPRIVQVFLLATLGLSASAARAQVIVPDDYATITAAIASGAEEVSVRPGVYPETPLIDRPLVLRALLPAGSTALPEIAGLVLDDAHQGDSHTAHVRILDLHVLGTVRGTFHLGMHSGAVEILLERCVLDSGLVNDDATVHSQHDWSIAQSTVHGPVRLRWPEHLGISGSRFTGPVSLAATTQVTVLGSTFEGSGPVGIEVAPGCEDVSIKGNTIRGYDTGLSVDTPDYATVADNVVEDCAVLGVHIADVGPAIVSRNLVRGCGGAILVAGYERATLDANVVEDCLGGMGAAGGYWLNVTRNQVRRSGDGIDLYAENALSSDNRVESCGGGITIVLDKGTGTVVRDTVLDSAAGISLGMRGGSDGTVTGCHVISCAGPGIHISGRTIGAAENVVGRSTGHGVVLEAEQQAVLRRNTSYANGGSGLVVLGVLSEAGSVERNIGYGNDAYGLDVRPGAMITLDSNDWFSNALGAVQGASLGLTDLELDPLFCDLAGDDVSLRSDSPLAGAPPADPIGALGVGCEDGVTSVIGGRIRVEAPALAFRLIGISPNPGEGLQRVEFSLARSASISVEVFDLQGRVRATLARGSWEAGRHAIEWRDGASLAPGVYVVRFAYPGGAETRKLLRTR